MKYLFVVLLAVLCCLPGKAQQKKYKAYFVADAHLDTQWNWDLQTTISEYVLNRDAGISLEVAGRPMMLLYLRRNLFFGMFC